MSFILLMKCTQRSQELLHNEHDFTHLEARLPEHVFFKRAKTEVLEGDIQFRVARDPIGNFDDVLVLNHLFNSSWSILDFRTMIIEFLT